MPIAGIYGPDDFASSVRGHPAALAPHRARPLERAKALPMPSLEWTPDVERATAHLTGAAQFAGNPVGNPFGDGRAAVRIVDLMLDRFGERA